MSSDLSGLTPEQRAQVVRQWHAQQHRNHYIDLPLTPWQGHTLEHFHVSEGVWNPAITSSRWWAGYLVHNNARLFAGKNVLDMGTGTGLLGIVMALYGARNVDMIDISKTAVENAQANVDQYGLNDTCKVIQSDLFKGCKKNYAYDFIMFNHPFFAGKPTDSIEASMLAPPGFVDEFLDTTKPYLAARCHGSIGRIAMPFFELAGYQNSPLVLAQRRRDYDAVETMRIQSSDGVQKGNVMMYELDPRFDVKGQY